jgi:hypothetical protein
MAAIRPATITCAGCAGIIEVWLPEEGETGPVRCTTCGWTTTVTIGGRKGRNGTRATFQPTGSHFGSRPASDFPRHVKRSGQAGDDHASSWIDPDDAERLAGIYDQKAGVA